LKHLLEAYPKDWLRLIGLRNPGRVEVVDADLSTVSSAADKILLLHEPHPWIVHLELQAGHDPELPARMLQSVAILLRPDADGKGLHGHVERRLPDRRRYLDFTYDVVRVWQLSPNQLSHMGIGTLPLLPLTAAPRQSLPKLVDEIDERLSLESNPNEAASLWTATYILMGLKYTKEFATQLLQGVHGMKESATYQAILEEGEAKGQAHGIVQGQLAEARRILLAVGTKRFGKPRLKDRRRIESMSDLASLERLTERLLDVSDWNELFAGS
jgi:predicted transposase YdaD